MTDRQQLAAFVDVDEPEAPPIPEWPAECPAVGIYPDVSFDDYRKWEAINASALKWGSVSVKHVRAALAGELGGDDTKDRKFGRAIHCRLLEPSHFTTRFLVAGTCGELIQSGKRAGQPCGRTGTRYDKASDTWYCGTHAVEDAFQPDDYISEEELARLDAVVHAIKSHKVVNLLRQHGGCEVSLVWERDGFPCKARLDKYIHDANCPDTIIDIKKCQPGAITQEACEAAVVRYGWDLQAYWYVDGVYRLTGTKPEFVWVWAEDKCPYDVRTHYATRAELEAGEIDARKAFEAYKRACQANEWPGVSDDLEPLYPPPWKMKRYGINP